MKFFAQVTTVCAFMAVAAMGQETQAPIPDSAVQSKVRAEIVEINKDLYASRTASDREKLAKKLMEQAEAMTEDVCGRYVMLDEAMKIGLEIASLPTVFASIDALGKDYALDAGALRRAALEKMGTLTLTEEASRAIAARWLQELDGALDLVDLGSADVAARAGAALAKRVKDEGLCDEFAARRKEIAELGARQERAMKAEVVLTRDPDDPIANAEVGRFRCFLRGEWGPGLLQLARGNDPELRAVAEKELGLLARDAATVSQLCVEIADDWWNLADSAAPREAHCLQQHAAAWYSKALPALGGVSKMRVEKRLEQLKTSRRSTKVVAKEWPEPSVEGLVGKWLFDEGEGTFAGDSSGNGNGGSLSNGIRWVDGVAGKAIRFDAVGDVVRINVKSVLPAGNAPQSTTWYQWVDAYPDGDSYMLIGLSNGPGKNVISPAAYRPGQNHKSGKITVWKGGTTVLAAPAPSVKAWHHCAYTYDGKTHRLYIDGKLEDSSAASPSLDIPRRLEFGQYMGNDPDQFRGLLDEVRVYSRTLSEREIRQLIRHRAR